MGTKAFRASVSRQDRKSASRQPRLVVSGCKNRCFSPVLEPERLRSGAAEAERRTERLRGFSGARLTNVESGPGGGKVG